MVDTIYLLNKYRKSNNNLKDKYFKLLYNEHKYYIKTLCNKYYRLYSHFDNMNFEDLESICYVSTMRAYDSFDINSNFKLSNWVYRKCRYGILDYLDSCGVFKIHSNLRKVRYYVNDLYDSGKKEKFEIENNLKDEKSRNSFLSKHNNLRYAYSDDLTDYSEICMTENFEDKVLFKVMVESLSPESSNIIKELYLEGYTKKEYMNKYKVSGKELNLNIEKAKSDLKNRY